ncbi:MAG: hypothetical protein JO287_11075 [Pseudonocardiales bacterium]|nr:hypothetical protein [Pseudonocardiales bacterium]
MTQAQVLLNLGREDQLDRDGLQRLVTSINRYLGPRRGDTSGCRAAGRRRADRRRISATRRGAPAGWVVARTGDRHRAAQGAGAALLHPERGAGVLRAGGQRAIDPMSKLSAAE